MATDFDPGSATLVDEEDFDPSSATAVDDFDPSSAVALDEPAPAPQEDNRPKLRRESFRMLNDAQRLAPRFQRDVADSSSGIVGGTARNLKGILGDVTGQIGEAVTNPFTDTEFGTLDNLFGATTGGKVADDLREAANKPPGMGSPAKTKEVLGNFVKYFEGNGITDGKEMMSILKDSIAENTWDSTTDDNARVLSDGTLRINPKFVANPDAQEGIKAINAANVPQEVKDQEIAHFQQARKFAATEFDKQAKTYDEDYRKHAEKKAAEGVTDPEQVFYSWPGLDRNWIEGSWDVIRDTVANAGRGIANTGRAAAAGLSEKAGLDNIAAGFGQGMLESREKQGFVQNIAAARGQEGPVVGTGKELGTTVLEMMPMFAGGIAGRAIAGAAEAGKARQILGGLTTGAGVYGYAGAQGYGSLMQTALAEVEDKAKREGRELTGKEINDTVEKFQGAALANGLQTALLSKLLPEGVEKTAINGLTARGLTGREVLAAIGKDGIRAAKPELVEFAKQAYRAGKVGFKDEAIEEGVNQFLEGVITKSSGADADKTWDEIGQETFKGSWMGGVVGGGLPVAQQTLAGQDPTDLAARALIAGAEAAAPESEAVKAAAEDLESSTQNELDEERLPQPEAPPAAGPTEVQETPLAEGSREEAPQLGEVETLPPAADEGGAVDSPITPPTNENPIEAQGRRQEVLTERDGVSNPDAILPPPVPSEDAVTTAETVADNPNAYSKENLATTFDLTPEQAEATDTLVQAMGLDTSRISLKRGGVPGKGLMGQDEAPSPQGIKGSFEQLAERGKMLLRGLTKPDVSTGIHELTHVARQTLFDRNTPVAGITADDVTVAEDWAGAKDGVWDVKAEEKFARGFERYLRDGEAPDARLAEVFSKIAEWFKGIYQSLKGSPIDVQISPEMRKVFDALVTRGTLPEAKADVDPVVRDIETSLALMSEGDRVEFEEFQDLSLKRGRAQNKVRGAAFSKKEEARFQELARKFRDVMFRRVNPSTDTPVGVNAQGESLFEDTTGSRYRWRNDSPKTKPGGYPDFGGDLAPVEAPESAPQTFGDPNLTSTKNAATDAELERMGFDPIAAPARKALGTSWDEAQAVVAADPDAGSKLVTEILADPRALKDDVENGVLLAELAKRKADFGKAQQDYMAAVESGNEVEAERTKTVLDGARGSVAEAIDAARATGTAWGRSGRFRQVLIDEDFSLVALENKFRTEVNNGKPLSEAQIKEVQKLHDRIAEAEKQLEEFRTKEAERVFEAEEAARKKAKPKVRKALAPKIEAARKRLQKEGFLPQDEGGEFLAQEALPEQTLEDLATIGASWLVERDLDLRVFTNRLKRMFGDKASPHAEAILAKAKEILNTTTDAAVQPDDVDAPAKGKSKEEILGGLDEESGPSGNDIFQLARMHVNAGVEGFENVMDAVLADLKTVFPELTLREVHDAYSGYGKTVFPSKAEDLSKLREYRSLARLTSQLEDAQKKLAPKRTGLQRDKPSERIRTLQKEVKEMMRKMGIKAADSRSLSSSLDAIKNRLKNEIEELDAAIANKTPRPEAGTPPAYDAEATALKEQRDARKTEYDALFPKKGKTDDELVEGAVKALDRRIAEEEKLLRQGLAKKPVAVKEQQAWSKEIAEKRAKLKDLTEQRKALRDVEAERLERNKKLVQSRIDKIRKRLAEGDYAPTAKKDPVTPDKELERLQLEEFQAKRAINEKILEARLAGRSRLEKIRDNSIDLVSTLGRALMTSFDLGHFGRQGGLVNFARPEVTIRNFKNLFTFSEDSADKVQMKIEGTTPEEKALFKRAKDAGLGLTEWRASHKLNDMEELFRSRIAKKIPGVAQSERSYVSYMNALRFDYFNTLAKALPNPTKENLKELATHVNNLTGRGSLGKWENSANFLATLLFSPKYWSSRLRVAGNALALLAEAPARAVGLDFRKKEIRDARKIIAKEYGRMAIGGTAFYGLLGLAAMIAKAAAGDDDEPLFKVGTDPTSSDFGKLVFKNGSRQDPMAGMSQNLVLLSRMLSGKSTNTEGEVTDLDEDPRNSRAQVLGRMTRSKLAPIPASLLNLGLKQDAQYKPARWEKELLGLYLPISAAETINGFRELGAAGGSAAAISGLFGQGVNTYGEGVEDKDLREDILTGVLQIDPERYAK